jgi:hypothetical protein
MLKNTPRSRHLDRDARRVRDGHAGQEKGGSIGISELLQGRLGVEFSKNAPRLKIVPRGTKSKKNSGIKHLS